MPRRWDNIDPLEKKREPGDDADREKRSWRDIDKMRDGSRHAPDGRGAPGEKKARATAAYGKYKSELNKLFDKGGLAEKFKDVLGEGDGSAQTKDLKALRAAEGPAFFALLASYMATHGMPVAVDVLARATTAEDLAIVKGAVKTLAEHAADARIPGRAAMLERLRTLCMTARDPELDALVEMLRRALGA